jgi:hypothetical protein
MNKNEKNLCKEGKQNKTEASTYIAMSKVTAYLLPDLMN